MKLYPRSEEEANRWIEDYQFLGYEASLDKEGSLTVTWGGKRKKKEKVEKAPRDKRVDKRSRD